jgi:putative aminopeptidase FrvX
MKKSNEKFLHNYMNAYAACGEEYSSEAESIKYGQNVWVDYVTPFVDEVNVDAYGTAYGIIKSESPDPLRVVIEAHADEICWMVNYIEPDGTLRVKRNGGSDNMIAASKKVVVRTHKGEYHNGVFGSTAIHTRDKYTTTGQDLHELWVDMGLDKKGVDELGIEVGNMVIFSDKFSKLGNFWCGRALDNKIGGYIIAEVARKLKDNNIKLPFDLYVTNSTTEEVGLFGAKKIAKFLQADLALVHDVCHDTHHGGLSKAKEGDVKGGSGPSIQYTVQNHRKIQKKIREVASGNNIPLQLEIGSYGNDTMGFYLENTPTCIISTPLRHMHCTTEMAHVDDVKNAIKLFYETLKSIDPSFINAVNNKV